MERKKLKQKWLKYQRKILVASSIIVSPIILSLIGKYCSDFYIANNISINGNNYFTFFLLLSLVLIVILANLVNTIYCKKLSRDTHNIVQLLFEIYLEDMDKLKSKSDEILKYFNKYGGQ